MSPPFSSPRQRPRFCGACQRRGHGRPSAAGVGVGVVADPSLAEEERVCSSTLQACEWPQVLRQLARFASTPMAREVLLRGDYPSDLVATSATEANEMQEQTLTLRSLLMGEEAKNSDKKKEKEEAEACVTSLRQISDVGVWLKMLARENSVLDVRETDACITCIEEACDSFDRIKDLLLTSSTSGGFGRVFSGKSQTTLVQAKDMVKECRKAVRPGLLYLDSNASPNLKEIREDLRATDTGLRQTLDSICAQLLEEGVIEEKQVVFRRDRYCVAIKRGGQSMSEALKGGLTLSESKTGQTVYVEPKVCVAMNNKLVRLRSEEAKEEKRVLRRLSHKIRSNTSLVLQLYQKVTELDLIFCRAKHAVWTKGKKATIVEDEAAAADASFNAIELKQVVHPVLLEETLDNGDLQGVVPVDIIVPGNCKVLTISGPNTGGKTATMKTIALCVHMAKCGIFIHTRNNKKNENENDPPRLLFFNAVLADIGDNQSIESNLSTFSSHVTRLKDIVQIIEQRGGSSDNNNKRRTFLVLLDEVGSGTNPREGSSLAVSVLKHFKEHATLTVATTHFSELKQLASKEKTRSRPGEWLNASVAFDTETLRPTYQLVRGESGSSNAMHIAKAIGLDRAILEEARQELSAMTLFDMTRSNSNNNQTGEGEGVIGNEENISTVLDSLVKQQSAVKDLATRSERLARSIESSIKAMNEGALDGESGGFSEEWIGLMRSRLVEEEEEFYSSCVHCITAAVSHYQSGEWDQMRTDAFLRNVERSVRQRTTELAVMAQVNDDGELDQASGSANAAAQSKSEADRVLWRPRRGDRVRMRKLAGTRAVVVSVNARSNTVTLKKGQVQLTSSVEDLEPV